MLTYVQFAEPVAMSKTAVQIKANTMLELPAKEMSCLEWKLLLKTNGLSGKEIPTLYLPRY